MRNTDIAPRNPFARLHWRLTLSYLVVTVLATVLIEVVLVFLLAYFLFASPSLPRTMAEETRKEARIALPLLRAQPVDRAALTRLLENESQRQKKTPGLHFELSYEDQEQYSLICVTDPSGHRLAHFPPTALRNDIALGAQLLPGERELLRRVLAGETSPERLGERTADRRLIVAAPIREDDGTLRGVVLFRSGTTFRWRDSLVDLFRLIAPTALVIAIFAGFVGFVFGGMTASRLTKRLSGIARAADAWAQGELQTTAPETGGDELALLARRLNRMARELGDLFVLRQDRATIEERHRLARELHDTVKQQVFAAALQVATARLLAAQNPAAAQAPLHEAESLIRQAQQELTTILAELRPLPGTAPDHLPERLRAEVADWSRRTGIRGEFLAGEIPTLAPATTTALHRITQEALANIARHSGATTARVFLNADRGADAITLSVSDNGLGFDPDALSRHARGGLGLYHMRERAEQLPAGRFLLESTPGSGTRIEVRSRLTHGETLL